MAFLAGCAWLWLLLLPAPAWATDAEGTAFLEANAKKEGVVVLPSGLQYKVLKSAANASAPSPEAGDPCVCHYEGKLLDGTVFDSSRKRGSPATFAPNQVIKGWTEALQLMRAGDRWQLLIPSELAYGQRGAGGKIGPGAALIFDLELLEVGASGGGGLMAMLSRPIVGPLMGWHVLLLAGGLLLKGGKLLGGRRGGGQKVTASHILVKEREKCDELKAELDAQVEKDATEVPALFRTLAGKHSTCPSGRRDGGSLGEFGPGQMVPAFDKVCWVAPVGEVQGPIQTDFGFHLILVTQRTEPKSEKAE